jgi:microcystin-dependent protein
MAETAPYFVFPFAVEGDVTTVPQTTQPDGSISYQQGWGPDYVKNLLTDPTAKPMGRTSTNQVLFDITTLLQQYSQYGTPPFITSDQNLGTPFPYPQYARVYYEGVVYENQVVDNIALPGTDSTWLAISGDSTGVLPGTIIDYAGIVAPAGYLVCDGSAVLRSSYGTLLSILSQTQSGTTTNTMDTVSGLTDTSQMYVGMALESANFPAGTTIATIVDANNITASANATASGAVDIQFFNWGNGDGSTTFNVPDLRRKVTIGQGGTGSSTDFGVAGTVVGEEGGEESHTMTLDELVAHTHTIRFYNNGVNNSNPADVSDTNAGTLWPTSSTGNSQPFNVMQPSGIVYKIIKT